MQKITTLIMVVLIGLLAVACNGGDGDAESDASATPTEGRPTATLLAPTETPIPTFTPITPTLTSIPSETPTPTDTLIPPPTATPTLSPTPQTLGTVITDTRVNVRAGDGTEHELVAVLNPGDAVLILNTNEDETWVEVALPDGETGWVAVNLLRLEEGTPPPPTETPTATPESTGTPTATPTRRVIGPTEAQPTAPPTVPPGARTSYILANCDEFDRGRQTVRLGNVVYIEWGWVADTHEQIEQHAANVNYEITLNDRPAGNWRDASTRNLIEGGKPARYWYLYQGQLPAGTYRVGYRVTWNAPITDGELNYGPGTDHEVLEFGCTFVVQ